MAEGGAMSSILHCCLDIRGAMRWPKRQLGMMLVRADGSHASAEEAWEYLADQLAMGRRVIPLGEACEGFDYATGCPGHEEVRDDDTAV
jgi:hypothetical protein